MEIFLTLIGILILLVVIVAILSIISPQDYGLHHNSLPDSNCPDCKGTGVVNPGNKFWEAQCPCKVRFTKV